MCKFIRFLFCLIPIQGFRAQLIQKHLGDCSECQREWAIDKSAEDSFTKPEWVIHEHSLWPLIQEKIKDTKFEEIPSAKRKTAFLFSRWQWGLAGLTLLVFIVINLVLNKGPVQSLSKTEVSLTNKIPQIRIIRAEILGKKARPFVYQTPENLFIWFDKTKQEGD